MKYEDFYDIAVYANENWRGKFTQKEIACNAYENLVEFQKSNNSGEATANIQALINALTEDAQNGSKEAEEFLQKIQENARFLSREENWIKFASCTEMYDYLTSGNDLYNTKTGDYVFTYNDAYALCVYNLEKAEAKELVRAVEKSDDDYWGAFLGPGGTILDDCRFDKFRFSKDENLRAMYLQPSFDYCKENFVKDGWMNTKDFQ